MPSSYIQNNVQASTHTRYKTLTHRIILVRNSKNLMTRLNILAAILYVFIFVCIRSREHNFPMSFLQSGRILVSLMRMRSVQIKLYRFDYWWNCTAKESVTTFQFTTIIVIALLDIPYVSCLVFAIACIISSFVSLRWSPQQQCVWEHLSHQMHQTCQSVHGTSLAVVHELQHL